MKSTKIIDGGSTIILRMVIILLGLIVLGLCAIALPAGINSELDGDFDYGAIFVGLYVPAIPFFFALHQALKLLSYVDGNNAFSEQSVRALKRIKYCALIISGLFMLGMPYIFHLAQSDDAPGVAAIGLVIIGASLVIATTTAMFQRLVQSAVDIKSENELTV